MRKRLLVSVVVMALLAALAAVGAQARLGVLAGVVRDEAGLPLAGAQVVVRSGGRAEARRALTDVQGHFELRGLPPGDYRVSVLHLGVVVVSSSATVTSGATTTLNLSPLAASKDQDRVEPSPLAAAPAAPPVEAFQETTVNRVAGAMLGRPASARDAFNTEAYDHIVDNAWKDVGHAPLSTFSIDVDTASYANVRRFLMGGALPPNDAVRIEEFVNYFSYDYPAPADSAPFAVTTAIGDAPWNPRHRLALIGLQARRMDAGQVPLRNLVFLVDVSGSMAMPNKLSLVKVSLAMLARNLTERDRIAIVVYAGAAGVVLPSTSGGDTSTVLSALARLEAGGSTNGAQGIQLAYNVARQHFVAGGVNRVVLASDGDFNVGVTSTGDLTRLIEQQRQSGIHLSVLGFGMGNLKDATMETLADAGDGNYAYIDSLNEAQKVLVEEAGGTLVTVAKDVKLQIEFNPRAVAAYRLIGYENRLLQDRDFNDDAKDAGDMGAGHSVTALYELIPAGEKVEGPGIDPLKYQRPTVPSDAARAGETMTVKVRYKQPESTVSTLTSVSVATARATTPALEFASAVAEFGMLLRDSEFKGASSYAEVRRRAARSRGEDRFGHRAEFLRLVAAAEALTALRQSSR